MSKPEYKDATICENGHVLSSSFKLDDNFCLFCGSKAISNCPKCNFKILGGQRGIARATTSYKKPLYCYNCAEPYPWANNELEKLNAILLLDTVLTDQEKEIMRKYFPDLLLNDDNTLTSAQVIKGLSLKSTQLTKDFFKALASSASYDFLKSIFFD